MPLNDFDVIGGDANPGRAALDDFKWWPVLQQAQLQHGMRAHPGLLRGVERVRPFLSLRRHAADGQQESGDAGAPAPHASPMVCLILNSSLFDVTPSLRKAVVFCELMVLMLRLNFSAISVTVIPAR